MPPYGYMVLVLFRLRWKSGGGFFYWSLVSLRAALKYRDGSIYSRVRVKDGSRIELERWESGKRVWVNPEYDAVMAETQAVVDQASAELRLTRAYGPGDSMPS